MSNDVKFLVKVLQLEKIHLIVFLTACRDYKNLSYILHLNFMFNCSYLACKIKWLGFFESLKCSKQFPILKNLGNVKGSMLVSSCTSGAIYRSSRWGRSRVIKLRRPLLSTVSVYRITLPPAYSVTLHTRITFRVIHLPYTSNDYSNFLFSGIFWTMLRWLKWDVGSGIGITVVTVACYCSSRARTNVIL